MNRKIKRASNSAAQNVKRKRNHWLGKSKPYCDGHVSLIDGNEYEQLFRTRSEHLIWRWGRKHGILADSFSISIRVCVPQDKQQPGSNHCEGISLIIEQQRIPSASSSLLLLSFYSVTPNICEHDKVYKANIFLRTGNNWNQLKSKYLIFGIELLCYRDSTRHQFYWMEASANIINDMNHEQPFNPSNDIESDASVCMS